MKTLITTVLLNLLILNTGYSQQMNGPEHIISIDVSHGQVFWGDPSNTQGMAADRAERVRYLTSQLENNASSLNAGLVYLHDEITTEELSDTDLLFIHVPSSAYSDEEVTAITNFLEEGGSLFLAMEVDYWSTLEQVNVNDILRPFGIQYGSGNLNTDVGGLTREGLITEQELKITYHAARIVNGGTPFAFSNGPEAATFGSFVELGSGGKIIVMGDAMASLYMNSWQGVDDYQTEEFMEDVIGWLLDK